MKQIQHSPGMYAIEDNMLIIERTFDAPVEHVWSAWSEAEMLAHWWGPREFSTLVKQLDFRVGGKLQFCMKSAEMPGIWNTGEFTEIIPHKLIVFTNSFADENGNIVPATHYGMSEEIELVGKVSIQFQSLGTTTRITLTHSGLPIAVAEDAVGGWSQSLDKLEEHIAEIRSREISTVREFAVARELVFQAWTEHRHLAQWWGPNGFTITTKSLDFREGGVWHYTMHGPDGTDYPNYVQYTRIIAPERIAYLHGTGPDNPDMFRVNVVFTEANGKTRVSMRALFAAAEARNEVAEKYGAVEGMVQTFDRLTAYIDSLNSSKA